MHIIYIYTLYMYIWPFSFMFVGQLLCLHTFVLAHGGRDLHHMARASQLYMDYTVYECVVIYIYKPSKTEI